MTKTTSKPERDIEIVESKSKTRVTFETDEQTGERIEVRHEPEPMTPDDLPFSVYVDGAFHGSCRTREQAEKCAAMEEERDETITERAVRVLQDEIASPDVEWIGVQHTGGGCLAAEIIVTGRRGYLMVTDPMMGYGKWGEVDGEAPYLVGTYDQFDDTDWVEEFSGDASTDAEMVALVRKGIERLTR